MPLTPLWTVIFDFLRFFAFLDPRTPSEGSKPPKTGQKGRFWPRFRLFFGTFQGTQLSRVDPDAILQNRRNTPATFFVPLDPANILRPWGTSNFASGRRYGHFSVGETAVLARFGPFWGPKRRIWAFVSMQMNAATHFGRCRSKITFSGLFSGFRRAENPPGPGRGILRASMAQNRPEHVISDLHRPKCVVICIDTPRGRGFMPPIPMTPRLETLKSDLRP